MGDSLDMSSTSLEFQPGGARITVRSIKEELGCAAYIKQEPFHTVDSPMIGGEGHVNPHVPVINKRAMCWDNTSAKDPFALFENNSEICRERELIDEITVTKHEPSWNEWELDDNLVIKEEPSADDGEGQSYDPIVNGVLKCSDILKQDPLEPEFVSAGVDGIEPQDETATMLSVDPLAVRIIKHEIKSEPDEKLTTSAELREPPGGDAVDTKYILNAEPKSQSQATNQEKFPNDITPNSGDPKGNAAYPVAFVRHVHDTQKLHKCVTCNRHYASVQDLNSHKKQGCSRREPHKCSKCGKTFKTKYYLNYHTKHLCGPQEPMQCPKCGKTYKGKHTLSYHMKFDCGHVPHVCNKCGKGFKIKHTMTVHMEHDCGRTTPHKCPNCDKTFTAKLSLDFHVKNDCGREEPYKCSTCNKTFNSRKYLMTHMKHDCGRYETQLCETCGKTFAFKHLLMAHTNSDCVRQETHKSGKAFVLKKKAPSGYVKGNSSRQEPPKPHKSFNYETLNAYMKLQAGRGVAHKCLKCAKTFTAKQHLNYHMKHNCNHQETHQCSTCGKTFTTKIRLYFHVKRDCGRQGLQKCAR